MYHPGDYVYPTNLPRRFLCRIAAVERVDGPAGSAQILRLMPLEGPWPEGALLVRADSWVRPA